MPTLAYLLKDNAVLSGECSAISGFGGIDLPVITSRKSIHCCQSNITMKEYSVCVCFFFFFLQILDDFGAQTELPIVLEEKQLDLMKQVF